LNFSFLRCGVTFISRGIATNWVIGDPACKDWLEQGIIVRSAAVLHRSSPWDLLCANHPNLPLLMVTLFHDQWLSHSQILQKMFSLAGAILNFPDRVPS
jgi:hypothetical protein